MAVVDGRLTSAPRAFAAQSKIDYFKESTDCKGLGGTRSEVAVSYQGITAAMPDPRAALSRSSISPNWLGICSRAARLELEALRNKQNRIIPVPVVLSEVNDRGKEFFAIRSSSSVLVAYLRSA